jgi:hypothetical protein
VPFCRLHESGFGLYSNSFTIDYNKLTRVFRIWSQREMASYEGCGNFEDRDPPRQRGALSPNADSKGRSNRNEEQ